MYFDDESEENASDPVLDLIEQAHRRETLIAPKAGQSTFSTFCFWESAKPLFDV